MSEKTFDGQTASFLVAVANCMPRNISGGVMQGWVQNPTDLKKVLKEALCPPEKTWTVEEDGTIRFFVTGLGLTGPEWIERLESQGHDISPTVKELLISPDFISCEAGKKYQLGILPGKFFSNEERTTENIRIEADRRSWITPETEIACIVRENLTNKQINQMGFISPSIMHKSISDSVRDSFVLALEQGGDRSWLLADHNPGSGGSHHWGSKNGFVFVVPEN